MQQDFFQKHKESLLTANLVLLMLL